MEHLIKPHGGKLCNLMVDEGRAEELQKASIDFKSLDLDQRHLCDLEMLLNGGFSPLTGFMNQDDYRTVVDNMRLSDGTLWSIPVTLDVKKKFAESIKPGDKIALRDEEGFMLAVLTAESIWQPDKKEEAEKVFGSKKAIHAGEYYLGGTVEGIHLPLHHDFIDLRRTPSELRNFFSNKGWRRVLVYQPETIMHRAEIEFTLRTAGQLDANLLIHPPVGMSKENDVKHFTRIRCYRAATNHYPSDIAMLSLLPLAMKDGSPRCALWNAIVAKNYGCTHYIGQDGKEGSVLLEKYAGELGIEVVLYEKMVYLKGLGSYLPFDEAPEGQQALEIPEAELEERLKKGEDIPDWFSYPEIIDELRKTNPPKSRQGLTLFFTGFSGSGKSTVANIVRAKLLEMGKRSVTLLDGDIVRKNLSSELTFSKEHRDLNIQRIGFVANEITKNGGIAICSPIAPYEKIRKQNRDLISKSGGYVEIHVSTPIEVCEKRDRKGLYAKARAGLIKGMTGIDDPYEVPENPEIRLDTAELSPEEAANEVILYLEREGYIR